MLLCCRITIPTVGVIRGTENSGDERLEAPGRHKTQKNVLIRTFHLVRLDFIACAVSVKGAANGGPDSCVTRDEHSFCQVQHLLLFISESQMVLPITISTMTIRTREERT